MLPYIILAICAVIVVLVVIIALQPSEFQVSRSATMSASPQAVFEQVNDFHKWDAWSPWARIDPEMKQTFEGAPAGTGAEYSWNGNKKVGQGHMTILDSRPGEAVKIKLEFLKPMKATNTTLFTFKPEGDQTLVVWTMNGKNNFMGKIFCLFMNMDKMVGKDFEMGLAAMKTIAEAAS